MFRDAGQRQRKQQRKEHHQRNGITGRHPGRGDDREIPEQRPRAGHEGVEPADVHERSERQGGEEGGQTDPHTRRTKSVAPDGDGDDRNADDRQRGDVLGVPVRPGAEPVTPRSAQQGMIRIRGEQREQIHPRRAAAPEGRAVQHPAVRQGCATARTGPATGAAHRRRRQRPRIGAPHQAAGAAAETSGGAKGRSWRSGGSTGRGQGYTTSASGPCADEPGTPCRRMR